MIEHVLSVRLPMPVVQEALAALDSSQTFGAQGNEEPSTADERRQAAQRLVSAVQQALMPPEPHPGSASAQWMVLRKRETLPVEVWMFDDEAVAKAAYDFLATQWSETFLCRVLNGPKLPETGFDPRSPG